MPPPADRPRPGQFGGRGVERVHPGSVWSSSRWTPSSRSRISTAAPGLVVAVGMVLLGAPVGLLWAAVAPRVAVRVVEGGARLVDLDSEAFIAADATYLALTAGAGVLCGLAVAWWARRRRSGGRRGGGRQRRGDDAALPLGLALGGVLAALVAWQVGAQVDLESFRAAKQTASAGEVLAASVDLRARVLLAAWAVAAVVAWLAVRLVDLLRG